MTTRMEYCIEMQILLLHLIIQFLFLFYLLEYRLILRTHKFPPKMHGGGVKYFLHKCKRILPDYCIATMVYMLCMHKEFDVGLYIRYLFSFRAAGPFYFVLLYLSLMFACRPLYKIVFLCEDSLKGRLREAAVLAGAALLSVFTTNYSNVWDVYGGGGKILGGTYLILLCAGMLAAKHCIKEHSIRVSILFTAAGFMLWIMWWRIECKYRTEIDSCFPFGGGYNPPSVSFMVSAVFMMIFIWGVSEILERNRFTSILVRIMQFIGRHTLYIFLYHKLVLDYILVPYVKISNIWAERVVYFLTMTGMALIIEYMVKLCMRYTDYLYCPIGCSE